jgi:AcrR family transcriptional regulator
MEEPMENWVEQLMKRNDEGKMTEKQIKIIQAAIETFSEKGYAASSTSEIAQKAGVAEGTIFRHYKTKKDLLISIVAPMMVNIMGPLLMKEFAKIINAPYETFEDFLRAIIRNRLEFVRNHLPMVKILIQEIPFHDDLRQSFKEIVGKHVFEHFVRVIELYQKEGGILNAPPRSVIRFIISNGLGLVMAFLFIVPELDWDEEEEVERTIQMMMHGLRP